MMKLSVIVPVRNEQANLAPLINELEGALVSFAPFEILYIDDGSTDQTPQELLRLASTRPHLRILRHAHSCGQSAAVRSGVRAARADILVTLDGDGQNDPAFIPQMVAHLEALGASCGLVQGQRKGRKDTGFKKMQSRIANIVRGWILQDDTRDTGCGLKCFRRDVYFALPYFDALHRFMPALVKREGFTVGHVDVVDRPRYTGVSNYGFFDRLWVGIVDLIGVRWLIARKRTTPQLQDVTPDVI
jgi:dolichol-phosphate mannosyltransferase